MAIKDEKKACIECYNWYGYDCEGLNFCRMGKTGKKKCNLFNRIGDFLKGRKK